MYKDLYAQIEELRSTIEKFNIQLDDIYEFLQRFIDAADSHVELEPLVMKGRELLRNLSDDPERHNP